MKLFFLLSVLLSSTALAVDAGPHLAVRDGSGVALADGASTADFGSVDLGGYKSLSFTLSNAGSTPLTNVTCSLDGADAADFVVSMPEAVQEHPWNGELAPGASVQVAISFVPAVEGKRSGAALHIASNDAEVPSFDIGLTALAGRKWLPVKVEEVGGNEITPLSAPVDFGSPMLGGSVVKTFRITNLGSAPLTNLGVQRDDPWNRQNSEFWAWYNNPMTIKFEYWLYPGYYTVDYQYRSGFQESVALGFKATLLPGESTLINVTWTPYETVAKTRHILVTGQNLGTVSIPVTGSAKEYVNQPPALKGLHYHLGYLDSMPTTVAPTPWVAGNLNEFEWSTDAYPVTQLLTPDMSQRWLWGDDTYPLGVYPSPDAFWRSHGIYQFGLGRREPLPRLVNVGAGNSATDKLGSYSAFDFSSGGSFSNMHIRLPARDDVGLELWFKQSSNAGSQCLAYVGESENGGFGLWMVDGVLKGVAGNVSVSMPLTSGADQWHHAALLVDHGTAKLYLDGNSGPMPSRVTLPELVKGFAVGEMMDGTHGFKGALDEVRLFELPAGFDVATHLQVNAVPSSTISQTSVSFEEVMQAQDGLQKMVPTEQVQLNRNSITKQVQLNNYSATKQVQLTNNGPGWLRILSATFSGDAAAEFRCSAGVVTPVQPDPPGFPEYPMNVQLGYSAGNLVIVDNATLNFSTQSPIPSVLLTAVPPSSVLTLTLQHAGTTVGQRSAKLTLVTNDPAHPTYEIDLTGQTLPAQPKIQIIGPPQVNWGELQANYSGDYKVESFTLYNQGTAPLTYVTASIVGPNKEDVVFSSDPRPGIALTIPIIDAYAPVPLLIRPLGVGARLAFLRITSNDPVRPVIDIPLIGRGLKSEPEMEVRGIMREPEPQGFVALPNGSTMNMGACVTGLQSTMGWIDVQNKGLAHLQLEQPVLSGPHAGDFTITGTLPASAQPGSGDHVVVTFAPSGTGIRTATLSIHNNDTDEGDFQITLQGQGLAPAPSLQVMTGGNRSDLSRAFVKLGTAVVRGFRNADYSVPTQRISFKNNGTAALTNPSITFTGDAAADFSATTLNSLPTGATGDIMVTFDPVAIGPRSALMRISAGAGVVSEIPVGGTGAYGTTSSLLAQSMANWVTTAMAQLSNGSVVLGGYNELDSVKHYRLRVVDKEGSELSPTAQRLAGREYIGGPIRSISATPSGGIVLVGEFTTSRSSDEAADRLLFGFDVIDSDGRSLDFIRPTGNFSGQGVIVLPDGKIRPTGNFSGRAVIVLPDGKILVGGNGKLGSRANLICLNADGSLDATFTAPEPNGTVNALALQEGGKILMGGEFTNLGQAYNAGPLPHLTSATSPELLMIGTLDFGFTTPEVSGLCRLNTDGSNDTSFGNPGFSRVTAMAVRGDRIAVGGEEVHLLNQGISIVYQPPSYQTRKVFAARLLTSTGQTLASANFDRIPTAVALQPGNRMLAAPGNSAVNGLLHLSAGVALIKPATEAYDNWAVKRASPLSPPVPSPTGGLDVYVPQPVDFLVQRADGPINALLAQADGKVLVGGPKPQTLKVTVNFVPYEYASDIVQPAAGEAMPEGFYQLDSDGFYKPTVVVQAIRVPNLMFILLPLGTGTKALVGNEYADGLSKLALSPDDRTLGYQGIRLPAALRPDTLTLGNDKMYIDGPDRMAFAFSLQHKSLFPLGNASNDPVDYTIHFNPVHSGTHRAVLHIALPGTDNPLEIALEGEGQTNLPPNLVVMDTLGAGMLNGGETSDFGSVAVGGTETRPFSVFNNGSTAITAPIQISFEGANANDFTASLSTIPSLAAGANAQFSIAFKPSAHGIRRALLKIGTKGSDGYPMVIALVGSGIGAPVLVQQPQDALVLAGSAVTLSASIADSANVSWRWFKNSKLIGGARSGTLTLPTVTLADAGTYTAQATNFGGVSTTQPAKVGVLLASPQIVGIALGAKVTLECKAEGPGLQLQWSFNGTPLANSALISGATTARLVINKATASNLGNYTCTARMGERVLGSPPIAVMAAQRPAITTGLASTTWMMFAPVDLSFAAMNNPTRYTATGLPPGILLDAATGAVTGKPTKAGKYTLKITASNAAGVSAAFVQTVNVLALPEGVTGKFEGWIERSIDNNFLGGSWSIIVTANGAFTAKLRYGTSSKGPLNAGKALKAADGSVLKGVLVERVFTGVFTEMYAEVAPDLWGALIEQNPTGKELFKVQINAGRRHAQVQLFAEGRSGMNGEADRAAPSVSPLAIGTYSGGLSKIGDIISQGTLTSTASRTGTVAWVAKIGAPDAVKVSLTGASSMLEGQQAILFALSADKDGGKSAIGQQSFEITASPAYTLGSLDWGRPDAGEAHTILQFDAGKVK